MSTTVGLITDSFYPLIDGVANVVENYASRTNAVVVAPKHPEENDSLFSYPIYRYPSLDLRKTTGYMAGLPFSVSIAEALMENKVGILHSHSPASATFLSRECRAFLNVPVVMTYHSKYDVDIKNAVQSKLIQKEAIKAMVENISSCDEVWTVSKGAGEGLKSLGFKKDYVVMPNGVDLPEERLSDQLIKKYTGKYNIPENIPVFLFVGRMVLYKGQKLILDALSKVRKTGRQFRMVFVGSGPDLEEIKAYTKLKELDGLCLFTGTLENREELRAWYSRSDLMIFPSTYDTNGLVVREAASCSLASVVLENSCVSEGITNNQNGFLVKNNSEDLAEKICSLMENRPLMKTIGKNAANEIYISWDSAVDMAKKRYEKVIENFKKGSYPKHHKLTDEVLILNGELMKIFASSKMHHHWYF